MTVSYVVTTQRDLSGAGAMVVILLEVTVRSKVLLDKLVSASREYVNCFDIPEAPAGHPAPSSLAIATYLKTKYRACAIPHVRLHDVNELALRSIVKAISFFDLDGLLVTMGDAPKYGSCINNLTTDEAVDLIKGLGYGVRVGSILSLRYGLRDIEDRLAGSADFFYVLRLGEDTFSKYVQVLDKAREHGKELYPYVLISTSVNEEVLRKLRQPYVTLDDLPLLIEKLKTIADGLVISSPLEYDLLPQILKVVKSVVNQSH